jgi:Na+:H+ antiporter, NhaA family
MMLHQTFRRFIQSEQFGGVLLVACTVVSLALANSPIAAAWLHLWHLKLGPMSVEHWINDALMAIFFLMIGLELERGVYVGALSKVRNALLPAFAAVGGMLAPALIHFAMNRGTATESGFGIPMATDIAFALAVLALLGSRVPVALKLFIVAYAIIDDLGAIVLIATVYTAEISLAWLLLALGTWAALIALNLSRRSMSLWPYLSGGVILWYCVYHAGIHASIAGVMLAFAIPFSPRRPTAESPSHRLERRLHKPVAYLILPLFALANTGVTIDAQSVAELSHGNSLGIALGLLIGKPFGVVLMCLVAVKSGISLLPPEVRWSHMFGAGLLGGIGFTMSIFITNLAFADHEVMVASSKLTVLIASSVAGLLGLAWLRLVPRREMGSGPVS